MEEIHKLRAQISNIIQVNFPDSDSQFSPLLPPPNERQVILLPAFASVVFDPKYLAESA